MTGERHLEVGLSLLSVYAAGNAGTTTYVRSLLPCLADEPGLQISVLANPDMAEVCAAIAGRSISISGSRRFLSLQQRLGRVPALAISTIGPEIAGGSLRHVDVVHYAQTIRAPRVDKPTVVTLHDVLHLDIPTVFPRSVRLWRRVMYDESARRADAVLTISQHAKARIVEKLSIDPARVHVAYHGVDRDIFRPDPAPDDDLVLERLGMKSPYLFYPASLLPHKNHEVLLQALQNLEDRHLVLTGPRVGRLEKLIEDADRHQVGDRVRHLGMVSVGDLAALYRRASCLVYPSLYEGFGMPILEAMASGCPVACSDGGATAEVAGAAGVLFDGRRPEAIVEAVERLDDRSVRESHVAEGIRRARRFSWGSAAREHRRVYEMVVC